MNCQATHPSSGELNSNGQTGTHLILNRAKELFGEAHPGDEWREGAHQPDAQIMARQAKLLTRAEDELLKQGTIESVDQS